MTEETLQTDDLAPFDAPFELFGEWLEKAQKSEINDAEAMALASVDQTNMPDVRMVLLKHFDKEGFVFFTNFESAKGQELLANMKAALCLHWKSLRRQVRVRGTISIVSQEEADAYFQSRPRQSQIGAWASKQSRPLESRFAFEKSIAHYGAKFGLGEIPRPSYWSGFRLSPISIEFWQDKPFRLHERTVFTRQEGNEPTWKKQMLYP